MPGRYQKVVISQQVYVNSTDGKPMKRYITYSPQITEFSPYLGSEFFMIVFIKAKKAGKTRL